MASARRTPQISFRICSVRFFRLLLIGLLGLIADSQILRIEPKEIRAGQSVTLSWEKAGASAFVIGYGRKVAGSGSAVLSPTVSTDFTMVTETEAGIQYSTARLPVSGAKGDDGYPSLSGFDVAIQGTCAGIGYIDFQSAAWNILQGKGYGVRGDYVPKRPFVAFYTNFALRPDLVAKSERIRARRLALAVEIYEPVKAGAIAFGVRPSLEFQYRGENDWRSDRESSSSRAEAMNLVHLLERAK